MIDNEVSDILSELSLEELNNLMFETEKDYYECMPVDIITFVNDPYYLGQTYGGKLFKIWENTLKEIFPIPLFSPYYEIILSVAIGGGKTTTAVIGMLYDIHKLLCLKNPQEYYGLTQNTTIAFSLFSATLSLANDVNWTSLVDAIRESPYFCEQLIDSKVLDNNAKTSMLPLAKNIGLQIGSNFKHTIGKAVFGSLLDEASFQSKTGEKDQAQDTYNALTSRADSRYANSILYNPLPGHQWLASSPKLATDFLATKIKKSEGRKGILIKKDISLWDAKPQLLEGKPYFYVMVGNKETRPSIIENIKEIPENLRSYCYKVPEIFRNSFEDDPELFIMDKLGLSIGGASNLFKSNDKLDKAMVYDNPFRSDVITVSFDGSDTLMDFMNKGYFRNLRDNSYSRFIMLDLSITGDTTGITGGYCIPVTTNGKETEYAYKHRTYHVDFSIGVKAPKGERINFQKITDFIDYLVDVLKYPVVKVGADQFQSEMVLQHFKLRGIETEKISVVSDPTIYENTRDIIESGKFFLVKNFLLENELANLKRVYKNSRGGGHDAYRKNYMYDHDSEHSKDIADTVAGFYGMASKSENLVNKISVVRDFFDIKNEEKSEDYYSQLNDEEFLEELKKNTDFEEI